MDTCALPSGWASDVRSCTLLTVMRASVFLIRCWAHCASTAIAESMFARGNQKKTPVGLLSVSLLSFTMFTFLLFFVTF